MFRLRHPAHRAWSPDPLGAAGAVRASPGPCSPCRNGLSWSRWCPNSTNHPDGSRGRSLGRICWDILVWNSCDFKWFWGWISWISFFWKMWGGCQGLKRTLGELTTKTEIDASQIILSSTESFQNKQAQDNKNNGNRNIAPFILKINHTFRVSSFDSTCLNSITPRHFPSCCNGWHGIPFSDKVHVGALSSSDLKAQVADRLWPGESVALGLLGWPSGPIWERSSTYGTGELGAGNWNWIKNWSGNTMVGLSSKKMVTTTD